VKTAVIKIPPRNALVAGSCREIAAAVV